MCGISGLVVADPRQAQPAVRRMMASMVHRGPSDEGYVELPVGRAATDSGSGDTRGPVAGLGFRRLSILDLSPAGHQPMVNPATGDWLVFNGEIYNFRALRAELSGPGTIFTSSGDTEILLHALSRWHEHALPRLQGMFSLAFFHADSRRLLLARDPLGIKPLYTAALPGRFAFASEIRSLLASGVVPADLDVSGVAGMLAYGAVQSPHTIYRHIRSFPAGCSQWIDAGVIEGRPQPEARRYWRFPAVRPAVEAPQAAREVRELIHGGVLRHLVADVPVGVFLSAGIDSTIVASIAREYTPQVTAFTVGFGAIHGEDEIAVAAATARELGVKHVTVELDAATMPAKWHDWLSGLDSPSIDGFNTFVVSQALAGEGVVVGLSGLGADELFGGYPAFDRAPRWSRLLRSLPFIPRSLRSAVIAGLGSRYRRLGAVEKLADLAGGDPSIAGITRSLRRTLSNSRLGALGLTSTRAALAADYLPAGPDRFEPHCEGDAFNAVSRAELVHYMGDTLLRDTDVNSMRHSLEVRVPFLDLPLVEYVSALPGRLKYRGGEPRKELLRAACSPLLSDGVANRPKTGFTLPIGEWMVGPMRESCEAAIERVEQLPFLEGAEVRRLWTQFVADPAAIHWSRPLALVVLGAHLTPA